jgi:calcineurin-like phosphoesterase family protein
MKRFFTSDTHFGHANIIMYSNRPQLQAGDTYFDIAKKRESWVSKSISFKRAAEMDEALIANWNSKITNEDEVYHLGDFLFGRTDRLIVVLRRLNFKKLYFIWGNHDSTMKDFKSILSLYPDLKDRIVFLGGLAEITVDGQDIILCHYALRVWNGSHHGSWHLYGHSHGSLPDDPHSLSFDVGVDCHKLMPLSFDEVKAIMAKKLWKPIDHHGARQEGGGVGLSKEDYEKLDRQRLYEQLKKEFEPIVKEEGSEQKLKE